MKKLIFALFPFAFLFGEQNISTQTEILLRTIDYEPDIEYLEASSEGENGIVTSYTINGVEVDVSALDSVVDAIHERISKEAEFTQVQQKAIADYIGFLLETKGIKYENLLCFSFNCFWVWCKPHRSISYFSISTSTT
jgi:hypothetical protein